MKNLFYKAHEAFEKLAEQLNATLVCYEISFSTKLSPSDEAYLWDRKHGMSQIKSATAYPNIGWAILQGSIKEEKTRFSYFAIHQKNKNILTVYHGTMLGVKKWAAFSTIGSYNLFEEVL